MYLYDTERVLLEPSNNRAVSRSEGSILIRQASDARDACPVRLDLLGGGFIKRSIIGISFGSRGIPQ